MQQQITEKDALVKKLYGDIKDLHIKLEKVTSERNEAIDKYDSNERYWKQKFSKAEQELSQLFELNRSLKEDNNDLIT